jgi:magnesium transporter
MSTFTERVRNLLSRKEMAALKEELNRQDLLQLVEMYDELIAQNKLDEMVVAFRLLGKDLSIEVFEMLSIESQDQLIQAFADESAKEVIMALEPDDRVRLLDEVPAKVAKKLLNALTSDERKKTADLLGYAPETAGRIMTPEYVSLKKSYTVDEAVTKIKAQKKDAETIYILYVTDESRKLIGVVSLGDIITADSETLVEDMMTTEIKQVKTDTDQEVVARLLKDLDLLAVPVVDSEERLVGIVTVDDAIDILEEEASEDMLKKTGIGSFLYRREEGRSSKLIYGSLWHVWRVRLPFLVITLIGGLLAGVVIEAFEETLEAVVALAIFIPVIMDMGGNVGTQSSTIFTRAVVLGQINMSRFIQHFAREVGIGASMGAVLGAAAAVIASMWQGMPELGYAVGLSLLLTITIATALGFLVPYILMRIGLDQAAGSDPIITTIKDMSGLAIYFGLVSVFLAHLL